MITGKDLFNQYWELAHQCKTDGMDQQDIVAKLEDMGCPNRTAEVIAERVFKS